MIPTIDPAKLVSCAFLGHGVGGGVSPAMRDLLAHVDTALAGDATIAAVYSVGGYRRAPSGWHQAGVAIDIDYLTSGYGGCRRIDADGTAHHGGEAAANGLGIHQPFAAACDRACVAVGMPRADLDWRRAGETTGAMWDRLHAVSEAVRAYLAPYYDPHPQMDTGTAPVLPGVTVPQQLAEDYDALRRCLVIGQPSKAPRTTRNPARGLFDVPRSVTVALCDAGCRWGGGDFGSESGDYMHFDRPALAPS